MLPPINPEKPQSAGQPIEEILINDTAAAQAGTNQNEGIEMQPIGVSPSVQDGNGPPSNQ